MEYPGSGAALGAVLMYAARFPSDTSEQCACEASAFAVALIARYLCTRTSVALAYCCSPATRELGVARSGSRSRSGRVTTGEPRALLIFLFERYRKVRGVFDV